MRYQVTLIIEPAIPDEEFEDCVGDALDLYLEKVIQRDSILGVVEVTNVEPVDQDSGPGSPTGFDEIVGAMTLTQIQTARGTVLAYRNEIISEEKAREIWKRRSLRKDLRFSTQRGSIFQASMAHGTGLVDIEGNVY